MTLQIVIRPTELALPLAEARLQCRIDADNTAEDSLLTRLIRGATEEGEHLCHRAFITQTWQRVLDEFPHGAIPLGMPPVQSIVAITYIDSAGITQVLAGSAYVLDNALDYEGWALPAAGHDWPSTADSANAVRASFIVGYGNTAADVPDGVKDWLAARVSTLYQFRSQLVAGLSLQAVPHEHIDGLLSRYRIWG